MSFVYPGFLFALAAISIPIIIHLFHFRRFRKVFFSNVTFLQQLSDESKKQSRLKHLLVLAARILAIVFLVMAFARPYIPVDDAMISMEGNAVSIYVDNSFSMDALASRGRLLDDAKEMAREVASVYPPADQFQLLTNDFEGRHQRFVSIEEFLAMVGEVEMSSTFRTIDEVITRQASLLGEVGTASRRAYLISDFQRSNTFPEAIVADTSIVTTFLPIPAEVAGNVYVDSCWFYAPVHIPGQAAELMVRIVNDSERAFTGQPVRLFIDDVQRSIATYDVAPYSAVEITLSWTITTPGIQQGRVEIVDHPVTFDDHLCFSYEVNEEVPILSVFESRPSPFLRALFSSDSLFRFEQMPAFSIDYSRFSAFSMLILDGLVTISPGLAFELQGFLAGGGHVLIFPGTNADLTTYADFLNAVNADVYARLDTAATRVSSINEQHQVYGGVFESLPENLDLPIVTQHFVLSRHLTSNSQSLMQLQTGASFLSAQAVGNGHLFLSAVPLDDAFSNFQRHALFVPTLVNIALQSQSFQPLYHILGQNRPVTISRQGAGSEDVLFLRGMGLEVIPEQRRTANRVNLYFHDQLREAGNYILYAEDDPIKGVSFNYDRRESEMDYYSRQELQNALIDNGLEHIRVFDTGGADFNMSIRELSMGRQLWRHFLVLALLFLLAEIALLRFWRG